MRLRLPCFAPVMLWLWGGLLCLILWSLALAPLRTHAQAPTGGPTCQEQAAHLDKLIDTQYQRALREKLLPTPEQPLTDAGAKVFRLSELLRITTQQCNNRDNDTYQLIRFKDGQIAQLQLAQQEQSALIQELRAQVASLQKASGAGGAAPSGATVEEKTP
jgi:hypothetical protein